MKIVFFGTPDYVVPILENLHKAFKARGESPITSVVTQEPKLTGRDQVKTFSPVDKWAYEHKKPIFFDPSDVVNNNISADIGILASYGKIIPESVINHFRYGIVNIHPSLLPLWRGSSPIQASIVSGEKITGVTFMKLDPLLDHGPIISQFKDEILPTDNTFSLRSRLFKRASEAIPSLITAYTAGKIKVKVQEHKQATFTRQLKKEDGFIPPNLVELVIRGQRLEKEWEIPWMKVNDNAYSLQSTADSINNFIRAMDPWPGSWTYVQLNSKSEARNPKRLKILKAHVEEKSNVIVLDSVQLEGKSPVTWKQFSEGYPEAIF